MGVIGLILILLIVVILISCVKIVPQSKAYVVGRIPGDMERGDAF